MSVVHEKILRKQLNKIAKELDYVDFSLKVTPISSEGANYTSTLFLATMSAQNKEDLNLFAKVATIGEKLRSEMFVQIFDVEQHAYNNLAKIYKRIQDKYQVPEEHRHRMPKFYGFEATRLEETFVLQDLTVEGYTTLDRQESMDWEYASRALEELAKWHALSIVFQEDYPEEYEEAAKVTKVHVDSSQKMAAAILQVSIKTLTTITDLEHRERLRKFLDKAGATDYMTQFLGPMKRPVLLHGDFRISNIMHRKKKDKLDMVIVDYQCIQVGCGVRDVLFFLLTGTDEEFRGKHFFPLLDHYYHQLGIMLGRMNRDLEKVFPRADFDYEVKMNLPWGILVAMFALPVVTVAVENAPQSDDLTIESITSVETSSLYMTRINGVIKDFVNWGVI